MSHSENFAETADDIWRYFENHITRIESKRRHALGLTAFIIGVLLLLWVPVLMAAFHHKLSFSLVIISSILFFVPAIFTYRTLCRGVWLAYKPLSHLIARRILGPAYRAWGIIEVDDLHKHGILPSHCRVYREEGFLISLHGYLVRFQEIDAVNSRHPTSVRNWNESSVGSGLYIEVEFKRYLPAHTILLSHHPRLALKRFLKKHLQEYQPVGLVSPRFENQFSVLSTDQVEARVAFHPAFMEKFMEIASHLNTKIIEASFRDDKLLIHARYKNDLFQIGHFLRPLQLKDLEFLIQELNLYGDIIGTLRLNPYTAP